MLYMCTYLFNLIYGTQLTFIFCKDVWQALQEKLINWAVAYSSVHVISGTILDSDHNGFRDNDENYNRCV